MIELDRVTKRYGRRRATVALRDVSLTVPQGAVWAIVGPNGAGKSTLLSLLLGFIRPSSGRIGIAGARPREFLRDQGAAYLPERFQLPPSWRTGDALRMFARLDGVDAARNAQVIGMLGLEPHLGKRVGALSRGLLQRLGLAQALLAPRALVVLDEPTEGLDPVWRVRLRDIVHELRAEGATVLIASHDLGEVERVADRAVLLDAGAVRELMEVRTDGPRTRYRIVLETLVDRVRDAFPEVVIGPDGALTVDVTSATELTQRLGALIALGAIVLEVHPVRLPLEDRVREALGDGEHA